MNNRIKLVDIELTEEPVSIEGLDSCIALKGLVRLHGTPLGYVQVPVINGRCSAKAIREAALEEYGAAIIRKHLQLALSTSPRSLGGKFTEIMDIKALPVVPGPLVTVAVCTHNRVFELSRCLNSLLKLDYPNLQILVVDNAPSNNSTEMLVNTSYPTVRYVKEPRTGLNWARNRAIMEARGEIIAFTDDDVEADPKWISSIVKAFTENPEVMAVTGLIVPNELESDAQRLFEEYWRSSQAFTRKWISRLTHPSGGLEEAGELGNGANMAFRRCIFEYIGNFDPALDVGTVTHGGGDIELCFRLIREGYTLLYEPSAIIRHRYRREYIHLRKQLSDKATGYFASLLRCSLAYPSDSMRLWGAGFSWLQRRVKRLVLALMRGEETYRDLVLVEVFSALVGLGRYHKARNHALRIAAESGSSEQRNPMPVSRSHESSSNRAKAKGVVVKMIDVSESLPELTNLDEGQIVRFYVRWKQRMLGAIELPATRRCISKPQLCSAIVHQLGESLLDPEHDTNREGIWASALTEIQHRYAPPRTDCRANIQDVLSDHLSVSIVVPTRDRPESLKACLKSLCNQISKRRIEIVVVDNNPLSGLTEPVLKEFSGVVYVKESRRGLSYARNKGVIASTGDIVVTVDDDVTVPEHWLEKLIAPFVRPNVMAVTGNVLPEQLDTQSQQMFESLGGMGHGFEKLEADKLWFKKFYRHAVPTWRFGGMTNAAFRASIFSHSRVGLLEEALGVGSPTGGGADSYFFYQILQAGFKIVYEPSAYVWHKHPASAAAVRKQVYEHNKGQAAYHLMTLIRDKDIRAISQFAIYTPLENLRQLAQCFSSKSELPFWVPLARIAGSLAGPLALWHSMNKVRREGRSGFYIPVTQRASGIWEEFIADRVQRLSFQRSRAVAAGR